MDKKQHPADKTRREVLKKAVYAAPAVFTLAAAPSFAAAGSGYHGPATAKGKTKSRTKAKAKGKGRLP